MVALGARRTTLQFWAVRPTYWDSTLWRELNARRWCVYASVYVPYRRGCGLGRMWRCVGLAGVRPRSRKLWRHPLASPSLDEWHDLCLCVGAGLRGSRCRWGVGKCVWRCGDVQCVDAPRWMMISDASVMIRESGESSMILPGGVCEQHVSVLEVDRTSWLEHGALSRSVGFSACHSGVCDCGPSSFASASSVMFVGSDCAVAR